LSWNFLASSSPDRGVAGTAAADLAAVLEFLARAGGHAQDGREGVRERRAAALVLSFCEGTNVIEVGVISGDWLLTGHIQVSTCTEAGCPDWHTVTVYRNGKELPKAYHRGRRRALITDASRAQKPERTLS
jgi:hypothetical protein